MKSVHRKLLRFVAVFFLFQIWLGISIANGQLNSEILKAARDGKTDVVKRLLATGDDPNGRSPGKSTPLIEAAYHGHLDTVQVLLDNGAKIELFDDSGRTALFWAAAGEAYMEVDAQIAMVQLLLAHGAQINLRDRKGETPLMSAAGEDFRSDLVKFLVQHGAEVNAQDNDGDTALNSAARGCSVWDKEAMKSMTELLNADADPNLRNKEGETALMVAVREESDTCARLLLAHGARIDAVNAHHQTLLHLAALGDGADDSQDYAGNPDLVRLLLARGVPANARDDRGKTALQLAQAHKRRRMVAVLLKAAH